MRSDALLLPRPSLSPLSTVPGNAYLPEIDGMRAIAVLSVFIFHFNPKWLPGGFTGVDVFFVISGFLISGLIFSESDDIRFSYVRFYQRRIARIVPAATLVVIVALASGRLLYDRQEYSALGADAVAAALSVMNVKQLFEGGYFTASPDAQPLIHYWSLAVEEQFYLVFPAMLHVIVRMGQQHCAAILAALCALGYAVSILCTPHWPTAAFYLLHTRAWELLAGAVLAASARDGRSARRQLDPPEDRDVAVQSAGPAPVQAGSGVRSIRGHLAVPGRSDVRMAAGLLLVAGGLIFARADGFPGWISILPVSGATLMLSAAGSERKSALHRALVHPALVFIGKLSFSLYLWHWVVFSFVNYALFRSPVLLIDAVKIGVSFAAAIATWYLVEVPARRLLNRHDRQLLAFGAFVLVTFLIVGTGLAVRSNNYLSAPANTIARGGVEIDADKARSLVLIGDSQGAMYAYDIAGIARAHGFRANLLAAAANNELPNEPDTLWPQVAAFLQNRHVDVIVVAQAWGAKFGPDAEAHLRATLQLLLPHADRIILIGQMPNSNNAISRQAIGEGTVRLPFFESAQLRDRRLWSDGILHRVASDRVTVMPIVDLLTNPDGSLRQLAPNGRMVYHDAEHLSSSGEDMIHARLEQVLTQAFAVKRPMRQEPVR